MRFVEQHGDFAEGSGSMVETGGRGRNIAGETGFSGLPEGQSIPRLHQAGR